MSEIQKGNEKDLLERVAQEYQVGYNWIHQKRDRKLKERELYVKSADEDRVNVHSIYTQMQMLLALYYQDKPMVRFTGRTVFTEEMAENLTKVAEFDAEQMGLDVIDYAVEFDRFYTGIWVKLLEWWDNHKKVAYAKHVDSLSVIPDPRGWFRATGHRWIGFELQMSIDEMKERWYKNIEQIDKVSEFDRKKQQEYNNARWYTTWNQDDQSFSVYFHYTQYLGHKYLCVTDASRSVMLDVVYLEPETKEEKKNPLLVPFPVSFKYFSPLPNDFYGVSVVDLLKDKQQRYSRLINLEYLRATRNALGEDRLYDPTKIRNVQELATPSIDPRYIEANIEPWEDIASAIYSIPKEWGTGDAQNMMWLLQSEMTKSTGLDLNTLGLGADKSRTLWESQLIQQNANLRLGLISKFSNWWDEDFWKVYYRSLQYNLSGEKVVRLTRSFGDYYVNFKRDDIVGTESIDIVIRTQSELDAMREKESSIFFATYATDIATAKNEFQKNFIMRKKYRLQGWSPDEIKMVVQDTKDEIIAKQDVQRLNFWLDVLPIEEWQDHTVFLAYYESAIDSDMKRKAIEKRKQALLMLAMMPEVQTQQNQWMLESQANASSAQLTANSIQWMQKAPQTSAQPLTPSSNGI